MAKTKDVPTPTPALKRLEVFLGKWNSKGQTIASGDNEPVIKIEGADAYEWLAGEFFLIHHVKVRMGEEQVDVIELIGGAEAASTHYPMRSFDNQGNFTIMQARVNDDGAWTFAGKTQRATVTISVDGQHMTAHWEQRVGSKWRPWMEMNFTKAKARKSKS